MMVLVGFVVVIAGVIGGFVMAGGPLAVLFQPAEFVIIGGAAIGSLLVACPPPLIKRIVTGVGSTLKGDRFTAPQYLALLKTQYELFQLARRDGVLAVEPHIEHPEKSSIFSKNEFLLKDHHATQYLCDTLKLILAGTISPYDLEALLDADNETRHAEDAPLPAMLQKIGDSLPGIGIVAAVLGIVITMQAIDGPPEEVGHHVAAALIGTFLGILLSYGFVQPLASHLELLHQSEGRYYECIKAGVVAYAKGSPAILAVEFARRVIFTDRRPTFQELETAVKTARAPAKA